MKISVPPFQFYNCILFCDLDELGCMFFFSVIELWFNKVDEYLFLKTQFRVKKEFFFKET
jgi:hypothetical protein